MFVEGLLLGLGVGYLDGLFVVETGRLEGALVTGLDEGNGVTGCNVMGCFEGRKVVGLALVGSFGMVWLASSESFVQMNTPSE